METARRADVSELQCAHDEERDRDAGEAIEADVAQALPQVATARVALAEQHRREPAKHGERPEREALASVVGDEGAGLVHALEFSAGGSRSD